MYGFALIGCGRIAVKHAGLLVDREIKGACLAAVCDVQAERAKAFGEKYNVPWYTDYHQMISEQSSSIDVISILTDSGSHAKICLDLCQYGKAICVEKPIALTVNDAEEMIQTCARKGIQLFVVKQNRFNLPVQKLRSALDSGRFGKLVLGTVRVRWCRTQEYYDQDAWRGTWLADGGVICNQASHHIDLLTWMMGEVQSVFAYSATRLVNIEADDTAVAVLKFTNGALGVVEATTATRPKDLEGSLSVLGENGTVEISGFAVNEMKVWQFKNPTEEDQLVLANYKENPPSVYGFGHKRFLNSLVEDLDKKTHTVVDGFDGIKSLQLIQAMYESMESGREIVLKPARPLSPLGVGRAVKV